MKVGSLFAGIGGFDLGFERAGFEVAWCVEWDKAAQAVLRKRFPNAEVHGDIREVDPSQLAPVDVICGGFPCQDLSVAGKRAGLAGERSGLFHDAMRIVRAIRPRLLVLENVPGLLSSNRGLDFATVLREVGEGWDCAEVGWRVLDSQYFGVAQRRRRVFIVGSARAKCAEEVLALAEGGGGDPPSRGKARKGVAANAAPCADGGRWWDGSDCAATLTKQNANGDQRMPDKGNFGAVVQAYPWQNDREGLVPDDVVGVRASSGSSGFHEMNHPIVAQTFGVSEELSAAENVMPTIQRGGEGGRHEFVAQAFGTDLYNGAITGDLAATMGTPGSSVNATGPTVMFDPVAFRKSKRAQSAEDDETWVDDGVANTLNGFDTGDTRTTHAVAFTQNQREEVRELGDCAASLSGQGTHQTNYVATLNGFDTGDARTTHAVAFKTGNSAKARSDGVSEEQSPTLGSSAGGNTVPAVAFSCKDHGGDASTIAPTLRAMPHDGSHANGGGQVAVAMPMVGVCVTGDRTHSLTSNGADAGEDGTGRGTPITIAFPIDTQNMTEGHSSGGLGFGMEHDPSFTLSKSHSHAVATPMVVRRLTPVECERLQGFPDGWTQIGTEKPTADSHRYKQLGNAVTVNVAEWIARRIMACMEAR